MVKLAIDGLTALEMSALELIEAAAKVGCSTVGIMVQGSRYFPFPESGLLDAPSAVADVIWACRDLGVQVDCIECFAVDKHCDPEAFRKAFEVGHKLGAAMVNTLAMDRDPARLGDTYGKLCQVAAEYGLRVLTEVHRSLAHASLTDADAFARANGLELKVQLDSLHFFRYGGEVGEMVRLRHRIGRAQISDGPRDATDERYAIEALYDRGMPGSGELPLVSFIANLPQDIVAALEVPNPRYRTAERIRRGYEALCELRRLVHAQQPTP